MAKQLKFFLDFFRVKKSSEKLSRLARALPLAIQIVKGKIRAAQNKHVSHIFIEIETKAACGARLIPLLHNQMFCLVGVGNITHLQYLAPGM